MLSMSIYAEHVEALVIPVRIIIPYAKMATTGIRGTGAVASLRIRIYTYIIIDRILKQTLHEEIFDRHARYLINFLIHCLILLNSFNSFNSWSHTDLTDLTDILLSKSVQFVKLVKFVVSLNHDLEQKLIPLAPWRGG